MRRSELLTSMQDLPSRSQEFLGSIAGRYNGHPQFALNRGLAYAALAGKKGGADADNLSRQAHSDTFDASFWSNGQTRVAADAHALRMRLRRDDFGYTNNYYAADYPFRSFYPVHEGGHPSLSVENALLALQNSTHDFQPVRQVYSLLRQFPGPTEQVLTSIKGRFAGNTTYLTFMASRSLKSGKTAWAEQYYRQGIAETPKH